MRRAEGSPIGPIDPNSMERPRVILPPHEEDVYIQAFQDAWTEAGIPPESIFFQTCRLRAANLKGRGDVIRQAVAELLQKV